jgi:[ribosomal protein S5]-alanine N-acetyltransferase
LPEFDRLFSVWDHGTVNPATITTRLITPDDAAALVEIYRLHRETLAPYEPERPESFFAEAGHRAMIERVLREHEQDMTLPHVILVNEVVVGRITLSGIARGPFLSARLGYWVSPALQGRGVATAAVRETIRIAFGDLGLHRLQAGTLLHNVASQKVLERNGFVRFGLAQQYVRIAGQWQDHAMYQLIAPDA